VSDILGHTTLSVTSDIYGHLSVKRRRDAAEAMDRALWGEASNSSSLGGPS
jgi:hypothetical protein